MHLIRTERGSDVLSVAV